MLIGLSIAAPVGPIGVLCIRRTLTEGRLTGFASGLGAASADLIYGSLAGFGLSFVSNFLLDRQLWLRLLGGAFLCYLGVKTALAKPGAPTDTGGTKGLFRAYASTFLLTLTNPLTILSFAAVFAGLGLGAAGGGFSAGTLVLGVFLGSASWWLVLSGAVGFFREKVDQQGLRWVNWVSGVVISAFGMYALVSLV